MDELPIVTPHVRLLTVNLDDEDVTLYQGWWPVPHGVALHAYLVTGEQLVLVDPWDAGGYGPEEIEADLRSLGLSWSDLTAVAFTREPAADLETRLRGFNRDLQFWGVPTPGARHDLGSGVLLEESEGFWFVVPDALALTGDALAGLGWVEDRPWAEDLNENEVRWFDDEALRWFSGRPLLPGALPAGTLVVAPAHGCLCSRPESALDRARRFEEWGRGPALDEVAVVWPAGAPFDAGADALVGGILDVGAGLNLFRIPGDDPTALAAGARRASLVVVPPDLGVAFLSGLDKDLWRPDPTTPAASLRAEVARRFQTVRSNSRR